MNLLDCLAKHNVKTKAGIEFEKSDVEQINDKLKDLSLGVSGVPVFMEDTGEIEFIDMSWTVCAWCEWNKKQKKEIQHFAVVRSSRLNKREDMIESEWKCADEVQTIDTLLSDYDFYRFLAKHRLFHDGRYLRNMEKKRVLFVDGEVITLD